ncbi:MAG: ComEA family DNA-binding protein [Myxococcales bacterium]|nr:ComEA family DNA-binding protein [Myxococcales bacterium]
MWWLVCWATWGVPALADAPLNLNTASLKQLDALPGLGAAKALAILAWRGEHGPFESVEELLRVPGIGPGTLAALRDSLHCGEAAERTVRVDRSRRLAPAVRPERIDPNVASVEELTVFSGIEARRAAAIVAHREQHGPFASCPQLQAVSGIGAATVANLLPQCVISETE